MITLVVKIEYDGTDYSGWQVQRNAPSVQETLNKALEKLAGQKYCFVGAGRTDAGVHARGQVAHVILNNDFPVPEDKIIVALNSTLPRDIRINKAKLVSQNFNARRDAVAREYSYTITTNRTVFDWRFSYYFDYHFSKNILFDSSEIFRGEHDFTTFSKLNSDTKNYICRVDECFWEEIDVFHYRLKIRADRFVYGMVRSLVGAMLFAARGKTTIPELKSSLEAKDRSLTAPLAPSKGLVLEAVYYKPQIFNDEFNNF